MRETVAKRAKGKKPASTIGKIKKLALSKIATPAKSKKNAKSKKSGASKLLKGNLLAKQMVKPGRRGVNPEEFQDPAHARGHRRLNMR